MANISIDTKKLTDLGQEILRLENEYEYTINDFFDRIYKLRETGEWIGTEDSEVVSFNNFLEKTKLEKPNYEDFGKSLKQYGEQIISFASEMEQNQKSNVLEGEL